jgi:hypothetical protein
MSDPISRPIPIPDPILASIFVVNPNSPIGKRWTTTGEEAKFGRVENNKHAAPTGTGVVRQLPTAHYGP